jgi:hypothetical protein
VTLTITVSLVASASIDLKSGHVFSAGVNVGALVAFEEKLKGVGACDPVGENVTVGVLVGLPTMVLASTVGCTVGCMDGLDEGCALGNDVGVRDGVDTG